MKKYPKTIFVQRENEKSEDEFLSATEKPDEVINDGKVAIYELKEVLTKRTETIIE